MGIEGTIELGTGTVGITHTKKWVWWNAIEAETRQDLLSIFRDFPSSELPVWRSNTLTPPNTTSSATFQ